MIRVTRLTGSPHPHGIPDMALAHKLCVGRGVELGAGAHNSFGLDGSLNVCPFSDDPADPDYADFVMNRDNQINICGAYAEIDLRGDAYHIPVPDVSQDYVISSHVIEHVPDPIRAFLEWNRVLRPGGVMLMIFPKRDSCSLDVGRPLTTLEEFLEDYRTRQTHLTHPLPAKHGFRGHFHVFSLQSMLELIAWCNAELGLGWEVVATEETDTKATNGHTVVARRLDPAARRTWRIDRGILGRLASAFRPRASVPRRG